MTSTPGEAAIRASRARPTKAMTRGIDGAATSPASLRQRLLIAFQRWNCAIQLILRLTCAQAAALEHAIILPLPAHRRSEEASDIDDERDQILDHDEPIGLGCEPEYSRHHTTENGAAGQYCSDQLQASIAAQKRSDKCERKGIGDDRAGIANRIDTLDRARKPHLMSEER